MMKKIICVILAVLCVVCAVSVSASAYETNDIAAIGSTEFAPWPGTPMHKLSSYSDVYWFEIPKDYDRFIFNSGEIHDRYGTHPYQTYDLTFETGQLLYTTDYSNTSLNDENVMSCAVTVSNFGTKIAGDRIVYFKSPSEWGVPSCYIWREDKPSVVLGDVDKDGEVSVLDATEIQMYLASIVVLSYNQLELADADKDGEVSVLDATQIQLFVASLIPSL